MAASLNPSEAPPARGPRRRRRWWVVLLALPAAVALACWWLTEPLADSGGPTGPSASGPAVPVAEGVKAAAVEATEAAGADAEAPPAWPDGRLDGAAAKARLLDLLLTAADRLNKVDGYTATFSKQERVRGALGAVQRMKLKVRQKPFALYLKFLEPQAGKEVVYAEGHHDNKLIAHGGGVSRFLVPRLAVPPDHPLALADARHPVTEAGLANLTAKLIDYRRIDLDDPEAETVLDRDGGARPRSVHTHPHRSPDRPFARVEVWYEPETFVPVEIKSFDWPEPGHSGELRLAEHYRYDDIDFDARLTSLDFDPANPEYAFHRY